MVKDLVTGDCFRADTLLKDYLERLIADSKCTASQATEYTEVIVKVTLTSNSQDQTASPCYHLQVDNYSQAELGQLFEKYSVKSPVLNNPLSPPMQFNLMFGTSIGPGGNIHG